MQNNAKKSKTMKRLPVPLKVVLNLESMVTIEVRKIVPLIQGETFGSDEGCAEPYLVGIEKAHVLILRSRGNSQRKWSLISNFRKHIG